MTYLPQEYTFVDGVFTVVAVLGLVLGVVNLWRAWRHDRVKLMVHPDTGYSLDSQGKRSSQLLFIKVTNLSNIPLQVSEVGLLLRGTADRLFILSPKTTDRVPLPRILGPRMSFSAFTEVSEITEDQRRLIRCAYAMTGCGVVAEGSSPTLKELAARSSDDPHDPASSRS